jgi:hypothetical protein
MRRDMMHGTLYGNRIGFMWGIQDGASFVIAVMTKGRKSLALPRKGRDGKGS